MIKISSNLKKIRISWNSKEINMEYLKKIIYNILII